MTSGAKKHEMPTVWFYNKGIGDDFFKDMNKGAKDALSKTLLLFAPSNENNERGLAKKIKGAVNQQLEKLIRDKTTLNNVLKNNSNALTENEIEKTLNSTLTNWILKPYKKKDGSSEGDIGIPEKWKIDLREKAELTSDLSAQEIAEEAAYIVVKRVGLKVITEAKEGFGIRWSNGDKEENATEIAENVITEKMDTIPDDLLERQKILRLCLTSKYEEAKSSDCRDSYCLEENNNRIAIGWSYTANPEVFSKITKNGSASQDDIQESLVKELISDEKESTFIRFARNFLKNAALEQLKKKEIDPDNCIQDGDYVWMRCSGKYYCTRINKDATYQFISDDTARCYDSCNQITGINWGKSAGTEDMVPGSISMRHQGTILRIGSKDPSNDGFSNFLTAVAFSLLNEASEDEFKEKAKEIKEWIEGLEKGETAKQLLDKQTFFYKLLGPDGVEDLLALWLFEGMPDSELSNNCKYKHTPGEFVCIPSTSKHSTQAYEYVLLNIAKGSGAGNRCFPQVKNCTLKELGDKGKKKVLDDLRQLIMTLSSNNSKDTIILFVTQSSYKELEEEIYKELEEEMGSISCDVILLGQEFAKQLYKFAQDKREQMPKKISIWIDRIEKLDQILENEGGFFQKANEK